MHRLAGFCSVIAISLATPSVANAGDVLYSAFPQHPKDDVGVTRVRATLIGYDPNAGPFVLAPYLVVRFGDDLELSRVFIAYDTKINGIRFICPSPAISLTPATANGICPRLPAAVALKLPETVQLTVWHESILTQRGTAVIATDSITEPPP